MLAGVLDCLCGKTSVQTARPQVVPAWGCTGLVLYRPITYYSYAIKRAAAVACMERVCRQSVQWQYHSNNWNFFPSAVEGDRLVIRRLRSVHATQLSWEKNSSLAATS